MNSSVILSGQNGVILSGRNGVILSGRHKAPQSKDARAVSRAAIAALLLMLTACSQSGQQSAIDRSTLVIAQQREPMSLNPALENGQSQTQWGELLFSFLVKYGDRGALVPDVATAVPSIANGGISADGRTVTYHLRKNVRFADGQPLTASDCVWSINAINNPANNVQSRYGYDRIASAHAPNATTLVLHLKEPFAPLLTLVMAPQGFPILPKHLLAKYPDFNRIDFDSQPIGSGPYVVDRWLRGDRVEMHANPYYFGGKPRIEHLVSVSFPTRRPQSTFCKRTKCKAISTRKIMHSIRCC